MTKIVKAKGKAGRRLGVNLGRKRRAPVLEKNFPPGQHGHLGYRMQSDFGKQLAEKQKLKFHYNMSEKQFLRTYKEAVKRRGDRIENMIGLLESRLDMVVYRANFAPSIFAAKQLVSHKHIKVNGQTVNIGSYRLKHGDVVEVKDKGRQIPSVIEATQKQERDIPEYLEVDVKAFSAKFIRLPEFTEVPYPMQIDPKLIIEYYSR